MILGVDLSHYQLFSFAPPGMFGWSKMESMGAKFGILRATHTYPNGKIEVDRRVKEYANSPKRSIPILAYYSYVNLAIPIIPQAEHFLDVIKDLPKARVCIDLEGEPLKISKREAANRLQIWLDHTELKTHTIPIIYSRQSWFDFYIEPRPIWNLYPLWAARYCGLKSDGITPYLTHPWGDKKYVFKSWINWTLYQYTNRGPGRKFGAHSKQIDLDWFNGTEEELTEFMLV